MSRIASISRSGAVVLLGLLLIAGCNADGLGALTQRPDLLILLPSPDFGVPVADAALSDPCGDAAFDPSIHVVAYGPPTAMFPLQADQPPNPLDRDSLVGRDLNGWLRIRRPDTFDWMWIPNTQDLNLAGTMSKLDAKSVREVARYVTVTCYSLKSGGPEPCNGTNGCCSNDDGPRYQARKSGMPEPPHQAAHPQPPQYGNYASRTAVDFDGSLFVTNPAHYGQPSLTKIANDLSSCIDRNRNGKIDTSSDTNGDGWIDTDCNGDRVADDIAGVQAKPCTNGMKQEFYGGDDECILWTTHTFAPLGGGMALGLAGTDTGASTVWVVSDTGALLRIDGATGLAKADGQLPGACQGTFPLGLVVDASGYGWTPAQGLARPCYFDTANPANVGVVRDPDWGVVPGWGLTVDRDQNIWHGGAVSRYTPDRSSGFKNLGNGWWTRIGGLQGFGIVADSRTPKDYFVFACTDNGDVLEIPASTIQVAKMDKTVMIAGWPSIHMPCVGVSVDNDQNVWAISSQLSTRALVDKAGGITQPRVNGPPIGNNKCPVGDSCPNVGAVEYSSRTPSRPTRSRRAPSTQRTAGSRCSSGLSPVRETQRHS